MVFEIQNKVAVVTGGASGVGLHYAKELLKNGARGITIADISERIFDKARKELQEEFDINKVFFIQADVSDKIQFEEIFIETIKKFKNVDILINNAGLMNDGIWETEIAVNLNGTIHGILLGIEKYLPKYKQGNEALIVNIASTTGTASYPFMPVYCGTKHAIIGMTKCWGVSDHYEATKVRVVAICPGATSTPLISDMSGRNFGERYETIYRKSRDTWPMQTPDFLAREAMKVIKYAANGTMWIIEGSGPAYQYIVPDRKTMKKNVIKCEPESL